MRKLVGASLAALLFAGTVTNPAVASAPSAEIVIAGLSPQGRSGAPAPKGPVVNLNPGMSTPALQTALNAAPRGATILFAAGTYKITNVLIVPCTRNLTLTGPQATPATAILAASYTNDYIFAVGDCTGVTIQYLHFENAAGIFVAANNNANITIEHNQFTNLSDTNGITFLGYLADTLNPGGTSVNNIDSNVVIKYNSIGDGASCPKAFSIPDDNSICNGIYTGVGELLNWTIEYNYIYHMSEGIHINHLARSFTPGATASLCVSCKIDYNYILNYHRIAIEVQVSAPQNTMMIEHNVSQDPINPYWGTFGYSFACCVSGYTQASVPNYVPNLISNDNIAIASLACGRGCSPYGIEFWGTGAIASNNLVEGWFSNGIVWGYSYGHVPWQISHNLVCGLNGTKYGGYIVDEGYKSPPPPTLTGNSTGSGPCVATPSVAPTISPASGTYPSPPTVTLTDRGQNTSIYYTTDGSTPVPGKGTAKLYRSPFPVALSSTVKSVGMWGVAPQPLSYPQGYGYVPSGVVSASYVVGSSAQRR